MINEEAIEILKERITDNYEGTLQIFLEKDIKAIETVLNLIEKQKAEIEDKQDEINVLEAQRDSIENQFEQAKAEIEKKDKMIDLMAIAIDNEPLPTEEYCIFRNFDCPAVGGNRDCKQCIKQYFEKKSEEEK